MKELAYRYDEPCNEYATYGFEIYLDKRDFWLMKALDLNDAEAIHDVKNLYWMDKILINEIIVLGMNY